MHHIKPTELTNEQSIVYSIIIFILLIFHEIGHSVALDNRTSKVKYIGFGFYNRVLPVLFADVSHIWQHEKVDRLIVNFGGIYIQLIINLFLILILELNISNVMIEQAFLMNLYIVLYSLVPFLRNDGYWILSDLISVNNLQYKSKGYLINLFFNNHKVNLSILIFSILNFLFNMVVLYWIFFSLTNIYHKYSIDYVQVTQLENIAKSLFDLFLVIISLIIIRSKLIEYKSTITKICFKKLS